MLMCMCVSPFYGAQCVLNGASTSVSSLWCFSYVVVIGFAAELSLTVEDEIAEKAEKAVEEEPRKEIEETVAEKEKEKESEAMIPIEKCSSPTASSQPRYVEW